MPPQRPARPPLRRLLLAALAGGLSVFGVAGGTTAASATQAVAPAQNVAAHDQRDS